MCLYTRNLVPEKEFQHTARNSPSGDAPESTRSTTQITSPQRPFHSIPRLSLNSTPRRFSNSIPQLSSNFDPHHSIFWATYRDRFRIPFFWPIKFLNGGEGAGCYEKVFHIIGHVYFSAFYREVKRKRYTTKLPLLMSVDVALIEILFALKSISLIMWASSSQVPDRTLYLVGCLTDKSQPLRELNSREARRQS